MQKTPSSSYHYEKENVLDRLIASCSIEEKRKQNIHSLKQSVLTSLGGKKKKRVFIIFAHSKKNMESKAEKCEEA